jgi:hypothetical protein
MYAQLLDAALPSFPGFFDDELRRSVERKFEYCSDVLHLFLQSPGAFVVAASLGQILRAQQYSSRPEYNGNSSIVRVCTTLISPLSLR